MTVGYRLARFLAAAALLALLAAPLEWWVYGWHAGAGFLVCALVLAGLAWDNNRYVRASRQRDLTRQRLDRVKASA